MNQFSDLTNDIEKALNEIFTKLNIDGTIWLENTKGESIVHNKTRAQLPLSPASTFKIPNTLIALDEGVTNMDEVFIWDGTIHGFELHNKDHTLQSAFRNSCVWVYQELAQRIRAETYLKHFEKIKYGNEKLGPNVSSFWLDGDLRISPVQQVEFLKRIFNNELPYDAQSILKLKEIMLEEEKTNYRLSAKTGYSVIENMKHGWYVGVLEEKAESWFFAMNMKMNGIKDLKKRKQVVMEVFRSIVRIEI